MKRKINKTSATWAVHNIVAHPISEVLWWNALVLEGLGYKRVADISESFGNWLHDNTVPKHTKGEGRG